jgi:glycine cleavage system aminomethyltransferase T
MAVLGKEVFSLMEKVTSLDLSSPAKKPPFLLQGPVLHVRCLVVVLGREEAYSAVLIACSRAYGQSMSEALLDAGAEWGVRPAGENAFARWFRV